MVPNRSQPYRNGYSGAGGRVVDVGEPVFDAEWRVSEDAAGTDTGFMIILTFTDRRRRIFAKLVH